MDFLWPDCESRQQPITSSDRVRSLDDNSLGGYYNDAYHDDAGDFVPDMSGILKLAEVLPHSQLTSLR